MMPAGSNPFSTRFIQPGSIPFQYAIGSNSDSNRQVLIDRLARYQWRAQICGPHGSGKTTLCRDLESELRARFQRVRYLTIRADQQKSNCFGSLQIIQTRAVAGKMPANLDIGGWVDHDVEHKEINNPIQFAKDGVDGPAGELFVVDGIERLSAIARTLLLVHCRRSGRGILATVHRRVSWLPELVSLKSELEVFHSIVGRLQVASVECRLSESAIESAYVKCEGNIRESLLQLYDVWQTQSENQPISVANAVQ